MKKYLSISLLLLAPVLIQAQQRNAISFSTGYNWALNTKTSELTNGHQAMDFSLGAGTSVSAGWRHEIDSHWVSELGFSFLSGSRTLSAKTDSTGLGRWGYTSLSASLLQARATIAYRIYIKHTQLSLNIGLIGPVLGNMREEAFISDSNRITRYNAVLHTKPGIGFTSGVSAQFRLTPKISFFTGLQASLLNLKMKSRELTGYSDYMNRSLETVYPNVYDREIKYLNDLEGPINDKTVNPKGVDMSKPRETLTSKNPYSSIGINFGLLLYF